jgi:glucokinase
LSEIRSRTLASAIAAGDKIVEEIVSEAAEYLGIAIGDVVNLMNPDIVVLGGGMVEAMPDIFVKRAKRSAKRRAMPSFVDSFDVVAAKLGDDATIMGAAAWAQTQFSANPR